MSLSKMLLYFPVSSIAILWIGVLGCGEVKVQTYPVYGKVTFPDGTPLQGGRVELEPVNTSHHGSSRGVIQSDGTFQLGTFKPGDGALEGEYRAIVIPPLPFIEPEERNSMPLIIDQRFQQFETSGLKFTVTSDGDNEFHIQVARPGQ